VNLLNKNASEFLTQFYTETRLKNLDKRLSDVYEEIEMTGTYKLTLDELTFGACAAWRNSNRCIGRLFWKSLKVADGRAISTFEEVKMAILNHLEFATGNGKIKPFITIFPPESPEGIAPIRFWNSQLIRYAAYKKNGRILGDPAQLDFTEVCLSLGWKGKGTAFDVLPVVFQFEDKKPHFFELPAHLVKEVVIQHPEYESFKDLNLKWNVLPVISDMVLEIGGIHFPSAPFNGWYMVTEIGSRNLGDEDRFNQLPKVAEAIGLNISGKDMFWKDRALIELNYAVKTSFDKEGVSITDHHESSEQFMKFIQQENKLGREVMADWSWIVPPNAGSTMKVFHTSFENKVISPNFYYNNPVWKKSNAQSLNKCPFHIMSKK
jgi:nitric-oxide synthase